MPYKMQILVLFNLQLVALLLFLACPVKFKDIRILIVAVCLHILINVNAMKSIH